MIFTPVDEDIDTTTEEFYKIKKSLKMLPYRLLIKLRI
ncbi:hypothetical protein H477_0391 [[Clostridium] sordellii ATCC 9714]|nr:hypothetical protein H477_0391 [[Clostridium] sordellii ATCC 9714] [Paeniclostridium sordellii ATCC 9714]